MQLSDFPRSQPIPFQTQVNLYYPWHGIQNLFANMLIFPTPARALFQFQRCVSFNQPQAKYEILSKPSDALRGITCVKTVNFDA